jgi:hypothetical protein
MNGIDKEISVHILIEIDANMDYYSMSLAVRI